MTSLLPPTGHPALVGVLVAAAVAYGYLVTRPRVVSTRAERLRFAGALVIVFLAYAWPLGDLAMHVSISAAVVQRLLVMLAVAPLLLTSVPDDVVAAATRPAPLDRASRAAGHPAIAIVVVTVVGTVTLLPPVITWATSSTGAGVLMACATVLLGLVLWWPVLERAPASRHLSDVAKGGYLLAASLVVTSLSFIWIFSRHVLYPSFAHQQAVLGLSAIDDQQLAGYIAKLGAYLPLWVTAFVFFTRAADESATREDAPLRWLDVQRELERVERDERRAHAVPGQPGPDGPPASP